ncbi:PREDICTED: uncharacterized protein LOC109224312 [Nicotiana attenuata]|uniref:uncharacterized protein LOC109224312 n=1 Tax=Nicotiana attenuata TaxID=49451 RepID=UPI0009055F59|nr:PREDICTED: uncharacterized protein LOC109224312 [Nicotiana attenuata]
MVDDGRGACIIHPRVLVQMRLEDKIIPRCITLTGFNNAVEQTSGEIVLPVLARGVTLEMTFHVMNQETTYNAIIERPWIYAMRVVPSSFCQQSAISRTKPDIQIEAIKDPDVIEACKETVEDLDPVQLDNNGSTRKAYIGHNLSEPDMPGIPRDIAIHRLNVDPLHTPVRQMRRKFNAAINDVVSEEVDKLLAYGSVQESKYPQWAANMVMVKKKNGKGRIRRPTKDHFHHSPGTYCYRFMPFGLKNAGATYQRLVTKMFKEQLGKTMEVYIDDMLVKSKRKEDHIDHLKEAFGILRQYGMKLNPDKCAFGITSGKFLDFLVSQRGIAVNPDQIKAIEGIPETLTSKKQADPGEYLLVYLAVSEVAVSAVLVRDNKGTQSPIYYISKTLIDAGTSAEILPEVEQEALRTSERSDLWVLYTDGASNASGSGLGLVLKVPTGEVIR